MERQRYLVTMEKVLHYGEGEEVRIPKELGYTYATTPEKAIANMKFRNKGKKITESLYGPAISENYYAVLA